MKPVQPSLLEPTAQSSSPQICSNTERTTERSMQWIGSVQLSDPDSDSSQSEIDLAPETFHSAREETAVETPKFKKSCATHHPVMDEQEFIHKHRRRVSKAADGSRVFRNTPDEYTINHSPLQKRIERQTTEMYTAADLSSSTNPQGGCISSTSLPSSCPVFRYDPQHQPCEGLSGSSSATEGITSISNILENTRIIPLVNSFHVPTVQQHVEVYERGIQAIRWLKPEGSPLFLSAAMDGSITLQNVLTRRKVAVYNGHIKGLRDVAHFDTSCTGGDHSMLSCGYDGRCLLWDLNTGQVVRDHGCEVGTAGNTLREVPMCVDVPSGRTQIALGYSFLVGYDTGAIRRWDTREPRNNMHYKGHGNRVNDVLMIGDGRRFMSCSDDVTLRMWDFHTPTQVKNVVDPNMSPIVSLQLHPRNTSTFVVHSLDNQVMLYSCENGRLYLQTTKRSYKGHILDGNSTEAHITPSGGYVSAGDGNGTFWMWDIKTKEITKKFRAHSRVITSHAWYASAKSTLVTASWDGTVKIWT